MSIRANTLRIRGSMVSALALPLLMAGLAQADNHGGEKADPMTSQHEATKDKYKDKDRYKDKHHDKDRQSAATHAVKQSISDWGDTPKKVARKMIEKYGEPDAVTDTMLIWYDNGQWERTIVHKEEIEHNFPMPHTDVLEQVIAYDVPVDRFSDLAKYDGSVVAYRTNGELSARCDKEAANILALNLAHDVVEGERSVDEARAYYAQTMRKVMDGDTPEYVQQLQFNVQAADTRDPDEKFDMESGEAMADAAGQPHSNGTAAHDQQAGMDHGADWQHKDLSAMSESELSGKVVLTVDGEELGEVDSITTVAGGDRVAVVEVGGILGIGANDIEIPLDELKLTADGKLQSDMSRERLISESDNEAEY